MAIPHAAPGQVVSIHPPSDGLEETLTATLAKTEQFQLIRLVVSAGKEISSHSAPGALIVQCLDGRVVFSCQGDEHELSAGDLLHLAPHEPHAVRGVEDGSLLLTIITPAHEADKDRVEEASDESFPASDPPAWTGVTGP